MLAAANFTSSRNGFKGEANVFSDINASILNASNKYICMVNSVVEDTRMHLFFYCLVLLNLGVVVSVKRKQWNLSYIVFGDVASVGNKKVFL